MRDHPDTITASTPPVAPRPTTRDQQGLLDALAAIDREGWDGETATALLTHIRWLQRLTAANLDSSSIC